MLDLRDVLLMNLDEAFVRKGWHGTTLRGSLKGVDAEAAAWRPGEGRHNIREIALHCAYWKYAVRRRLTGEKRGSFPLAGSNWFASPDAPLADAWREALRLLDEQHVLLRAAVEALPKARLGDRKSVRLVYGVAAHDLYHCGQIQLLKRLRE